jgi:ribonuclease E
MPSLPKCGVSRKIEDGHERKRLKRIVRELDETGHGGMGFIVRTAGVNKSLQDLQRDRDYLKKIWEMVAQRLKVTRAPALLYQESDLVLKAMRDQFTPDIADVVVDCEDVFLRIRDFAEKLMPHMAERIKQHAMTTPLYHHFGIEKDVESLYQPKVELPNGASIVIDQAEALVAIDVNSGRYKAGGDTDETAYRTNLDAIPEIVRQLRLRDLGGLIIIDFIDMAHEKQRRGVERKLIEALRGDRSRIKVARISPFGMLEITRQRVGPGLKRTVFMQCPHCKGAGWSRTVQSKALSVLRESRALVNLKGFSVLQIFVAPAVADYLVNYKRRAVLELEDAVGKSLVFRPEASYPIDVVHYRFLTGDGQEARIAIPAGYPFRDGPRAFLSPAVWHPNVFPDGQVCQGRTWRVSEFLDLYVERMLRILSFQEEGVNLQSVANAPAAGWYRTASARAPQSFPTDALDMPDALRAPGRRVGWQDAG